MSADERRYVAQAARNARAYFFRLEEEREQERREKALAKRPRWNDYPVLLRMTNQEAETLLAGVLQRLSTTPAERPFSSAEISDASCLVGTLWRAEKVDGQSARRQLLAAARRHAQLQGIPEKGAEKFADEALSLGYWADGLKTILEGRRR